LQRGRLVTEAIMWKVPPEGEEGHSSCKKRWQLQKAGRAVYWRNKRGMDPGEL
jgi:hypothetical protein